MFLAQLGQVQAQCETQEKSAPQEIWYKAQEMINEGTVFFANISQDKLALLSWYYWEGQRWVWQSPTNQKI